GGAGTGRTGAPGAPAFAAAGAAGAAAPSAAGASAAAGRAAAGPDAFFAGCRVPRALAAAAAAATSPPAGNISFSRRATGASTVDDALFTNSPISLSLARTTLLSTPSSLASSWTRALPATGLL